MSDPLEVARSVVDDARAAGAAEAEATVSVTSRFSAEARDRTIVKLEQSVGRTLNLRVFIEQRKASLATTDFSAHGLRAFVRRTVDAARFVTADPCAGLPDPPSGAPPEADLGIDFDDVREREAGAKLDDAKRLESVARAADPRIVNSNGSRVADAVATMALANSHGLAASYRATSVSRSASPVAVDGTAKRTASYGSAARSYAAIEAVDAVAARAARRTVELCGAKKPPTMRVPVIFERDVAASVLADLFAALSAANVAVGNSFLADRMGERIGSDLVTIVDDGLLAGGLGSSPFDAEGTPSRRTVVFERGVLRTFLYDTYYARRLGASTTANAAGGGIGPNNFYLVAGSQTLDELIGATPRGVLILDTIGFATEHASGTYSRGARGFAIENGELAYPIDEFTIAGNFRTMLEGIDAVASDLRFDGPIVAPSFRVAEMTVSGN